MSININHKTSSLAPRQLTELDEKRKMACEVLKRVDQLIKAKDLQKALFETIHAKEIDPHNVYALALEERIQDLLAGQMKARQQEQHKESRSEPKIRDPQDCPKELLAEPPTVMIHNINSITPSVVTQAQQEKMRMSSVIVQKPDEHRESILMPTPEIKKNNNDSKIKRKPKVLMIDDDISLLSALSMTIESGGFEAISFSTSDEAYVLLNKFTPDIILCDINLETSTMGGFTFFERVQEIDRLKRIPFIFLSGLNDDVLIRAGKEMGADDYLTKPIKEQNLLAALRGKIKRFEQLKEMPSANIHNSAAALPLREIHY